MAQTSLRRVPCSAPPDISAARVPVGLKLRRSATAHTSADEGAAKALLDLQRRAFDYKAERALVGLQLRAPGKRAPSSPLSSLTSDDNEAVGSPSSDDDDSSSYAPSRVSSTSSSDGQFRVDEDSASSFVPSDASSSDTSSDAGDADCVPSSPEIPLRIVTRVIVPLAREDVVLRRGRARRGTMVLHDSDSDEGGAINVPRKWLEEREEGEISDSEPDPAGQRSL